MSDDGRLLPVRLRVWRAGKLSISPIPQSRLSPYNVALPALTRKPEARLRELSVCHPSSAGHELHLLARYYAQWNRCGVHQVEVRRPEQIKLSVYQRLLR